MNFTQWYESFYGDMKYNSDTYFASETAWIACNNNLKKEILKILEKDAITYHEACASGTIEEIEKLC